MPLYEYKCKSCGDIFEVMQKFSDEPLTLHEACGGAVERLISAPAFQFKGTGWYITDYARSNGASNGAGNRRGEETAKPGGETKSESKTEPKAEAKAAPPAK